jgi:hypothetical protein
MTDDVCPACLGDRAHWMAKGVCLPQRWNEFCVKQGCRFSGHKCGQAIFQGEPQAPSVKEGLAG